VRISGVCGLVLGNLNAFDLRLFGLGQLTLSRGGQLGDDPREGPILGSQTIVLSL